MVGVAPDGRIGPATLAADRKADPTEGIARLCDARLAWLKTLKTWPTFGGGWERRVTEVRYNALLGAADEAFAKAVVEDVVADDKVTATIPRTSKAHQIGILAAAIIGAGCAPNYRARSRGRPLIHGNPVSSASIPTKILA